MDVVAALRRECGALTALLATLTPADLDRPVAGCPGWCVRDLLGHLSGVHRWASAAVATGRPGEEPAPPHQDGLLPAWVAAGITELLDTVGGADPGAPAWAFGPPPGTAAFWQRRQAHETAVHRWDLARALDRPATLDPTLAADGVDEVVAMFFPRQVRLGRLAPLDAVIRLADADSWRSWLVHGDGTTPAPRAPDAEITAPAGQLLLLLWGRADRRSVRVGGDGDAVDRMLATGLVP